MGLGGGQPSRSTWPGSIAAGSEMVSRLAWYRAGPAGHAVRGGWPALYQANRDTISDPAAIDPGQVLRLG
ncbi:MAG TPA: hypothetical protein VFC16_13240 [Nakamurella sp.]|nr:hypothetical protein [Nakamurella sp.]